MNLIHTLRRIRPVPMLFLFAQWRRSQACCRSLALLLHVVLFSLAGPALGQTISTVAGNGSLGSGGDGGPATSAQLSGPIAMAMDSVGNLYIADANNNRVRKVDAVTGQITTVAGTGAAGSDGDTGLATDAQLDNPLGLAVDSAGNLYISTRAGNRVRKIDALTGRISTVAGTGPYGYNGDGILATAARLAYPHGLAIDADDNLYIAERGTHRVRRVDAVTGAISTVAGNGTQGFGGDGGPATAAQLDTPFAVDIDALGNLYVADSFNHRIRKVDAVTGRINTIAGTGVQGFNGDGPNAAAANLDGPRSLLVGALGELYIADTFNHRVRMVDSAGAISTVAGTVTAGFSGDGGASTSAQLSVPAGVLLDPAGNLYIADYSNQRIRKVVPTVPGAPTTATATPGNAQATVSWTAPTSNGGGAITGYAVTAVEDTTKTCTPVPVTATTCVVSGLANGTSYTFNVKASNSAGASPASAPSTAVTPLSVPGAATLVTAVVGNAQATVSWTAPTSNGGGAITGYAVTAVEDTTKTCTPVPVTATTCVVSGLANGTSYTFNVKASNSAGASPASAPSTAVTPLGVPGAPTLVTTVAGNAQANVSWTAPALTGGGPITSYTVTGAPAGSCTVAAPATTCVVPTLANGTAYAFTVVASNGLWPSAASAPSTAVTPLGVPGAPTLVTAVAGNAQANVSWTAPALTGGGPITSYTVTGSPAGSCTVAAPATTCVVPTLANGTAYAFTVVASNGLWPSAASAPSAPVTPKAPPVADPGPSHLPITTPGATTTITDPHLPIVIGSEAGGGTIVLPGTGSTPVPLQVTINGQALQVQATPGSYLRVAQVNGQNVLVLVVINGWASMASAAAGQPMALAGEVLLSSGGAGTRIEAQPFTVAVLQGSLLAPKGSFLQLGDKGLLVGEKLLVDNKGKLVTVSLGSLKGDAGLVGDGMDFANLPTAITVDGTAFARLGGAVTRLAGANLNQGLEVAPTGVALLRADSQIFQLLPTSPITVDATQPDGLAFTPLGLLRWVQRGVVVQFAPAVADLAGLANAVTAALPGAKLKLGAEGVLQLSVGGQTYVLRPDWTGAGMATGRPEIGVDAQGRIVFQMGQGARQLLLPAVLSAAQANDILTTAIPGATLAVQAGARDGALALTLGAQSWRLVPQWVLPGSDTSQTTPWRMGGDGLLYLQLGTQVQGLQIAD